jgi:hypothetical protein
MLEEQNKVRLKMLQRKTRSNIEAYREARKEARKVCRKKKKYYEEETLEPHRTTYGDSVWYVTVTTDSVLANSKTQNAFLFRVHAMFRHDCTLAVKPASTPRRLVHKKTWRGSLPVDMLPFGVTIPATVLQRSEIPEELMNYPVINFK